MGYSPWGHKRVGHDLATKQLGLLLPINYIIPENKLGDTPDAQGWFPS